MEEKELWMNKLKEKLELLGAASCFRLGTTGKRTYASCGEEDISLS